MEDFSEILLSSKVESDSYHVNFIDKFSEVIENCHLIDLEATSIIYIWYKK